MNDDGRWGRFLTCRKKFRLLDHIDMSIALRIFAMTAFSALITAPLAVPAAEPIDFAHDIVPIIRQHCGQCHTGDKKKGGFSMNTRAALIAGGESGAGVVPGKSGQSELLR